VPLCPKTLEGGDSRNQRRYERSFCSSCVGGWGKMVLLESSR